MVGSHEIDGELFEGDVDVDEDEPSQWSETADEEKEKGEAIQGREGEEMAAMGSNRYWMRAEREP